MPEQLESPPVCSIIMPNNAKLREAYLAVLKELYVTQNDKFGFEELINIISLDCGISHDTARDKVIQLSRFKLLRYLSTSIQQHTYLVCVFHKHPSGRPVQVDDWDRFSELFEENFPDFVELDLAKIQRLPSFPINPGIKDTVETLCVANELKNIVDHPAITPCQDTIISSFKTEVKMSTRDLVSEIERARENNTSPPYDHTTEDQDK